MSKKDTILYLISSLLIAGVYYACTIVVEPLILPPTFAAPIWPAAGFSVGIMLLWGYKYIPAIAIAIFISYLNIYDINDITANSTTISYYLLSFSATLFKPIIATYLVKKHLGLSNHFLTASSIVKLNILAAVIPTLLSALVSTLAFHSLGLIKTSSLFYHFFTWWLGDIVGITIILPILFVIFKKPRHVWKPRLWKTLIPISISLTLLIITAINLKQLEYERLVETTFTKINKYTELVMDKYNETNYHNQGRNSTKLVDKINTLFINHSNEVIQNTELKNIQFKVYLLKNSNKELIYQSHEESQLPIKYNVTNKINFGNYEWIISATPTISSYNNKGSWLIWWLLSIGFIFISALASGLLVVTGNTILIKDQVDKRTAEINTLNKFLKESEHKYKQLVEIQPVVFWKYIVGKSNLDYVSSEAGNIFGFKSKNLKNIRFILNKIIYPADRSMVIKKFSIGMVSNQSFTIKYRAMDINGKVMWFKDYITSQKYGDQYELLGLKIEITREQLSSEKITQLAYYDTMTKLPNRIKFMSGLKAVIKQTNKKETFGAVLYLDLDRFKVLNDSMGHYFGDKLLIEIGNRLSKLLRPNDIASRFGGDEFVVLLSNDNKSMELFKEKAHNVAEKVKNDISKKFYIDGYTFYITCSIGISIFPFDSDKADEIIQQADIAMYESKNKGKNTISFFEASMQQKANRRLYIEKSLKIALKNQEFEMYYQPIFNTKKETIKLEALIRWNHVEEGVLSPNSFIKIAEETGFVNELTHWIIDDVFSKIHQCSKGNIKTLPVSINISLFQFENTQLLDVLKDASKTYSINNKLITIELTESIGISNFDSALEKLNKIKKMGFTIAIDDFGTGYSSLNYLTQMPIDILKLDMSFVAKIGKDKNSETLIETIILMAKKLDFELVVEGVETEKQFRFLSDLGCEEFQGHLLSQALPFDELIKKLS